jgi:hypothetical protein
MNKHSAPVEFAPGTQINNGDQPHIVLLSRPATQNIRCPRQAQVPQQCQLKHRPAADTGAVADGERARRAANIERIGVERGPRSPDGLHLALKIAATCTAESAIKYTPFAVTLKQEPQSTFPHSSRLAMCQQSDTVQETEYIIVIIFPRLPYLTNICKSNNNSKTWPVNKHW